MNCPQPRIPLPAEGSESRYRYLHTADHWSAYEKVFFLLVTSVLFKTVSLLYYADQSQACADLN